MKFLIALLLMFLLFKMVDSMTSSYSKEKTKVNACVWVTGKTPEETLRLYNHCMKGK